MNSTKVSALTPGDAADPIEIRVLRVWKPFSRITDYCYLFVDKHGDAIEVVAKQQDRMHFDTIIRLTCCYRLSNYICESAKRTMKTVPHVATIRIGKAARFNEIPEDGFPLHYFNFVPYEKLQMHYIGMLHDTTEGSTPKKKNMLKLKLQDPNDNFIEATLWEEIANSFDHNALSQATPPVIASVKITQYQGKLQLSSTPATYIYFNPDIELANTYATRFREKEPSTAITNVTYTKSESEKNRVTLPDLLKQNLDDHIGSRFTCVTKIINIDNQHGWYYKACTECPKKVQRRGLTYACEDHGDVVHPKPIYCLTVIIGVDAISTSATCFDKAVMSLIETKCETMVVQEGYTEPRIIPTPLESIKGSTHIFQLQVTKQRYATVNQVFKLTEDIAQNPATSTPVIITPSPAPSAPLPTQTATRKRLLFDTP